MYFDLELIEDIDVNQGELELNKLDNLQVNYIEDVVYISGLINTNACDSFIGDFKIKEDELSLLFKNNSEEPCMSNSKFKIRVLIKNPSKKKYNVVYKVEN